MTRFLSDCLQAREPSFRLGLKNLEPGGYNTDIRFSTHIRHATQAKMREMGLDPHDTTPEELYHLLQTRLQADDARLTRRLRTEAATHVSAEGEVVSGMAHVLKTLPDSKDCFALKNSSLRAVLRKLPPKKTMKQMGYRSLDSFVKQETPVSILAAAWLNEGVSWQHRLLEQYKQLTPADFEIRDVIITRPDSRRWRELARSAAKAKKHTVLSFKEAGALVLLPIPEDAPDGAVTATLTLALHELNRIRAASTFLKLCQVRPDFGTIVKTVAREEPELGVKLLEQPLSWSLIQRYYARLTEQFREELFEPHIRLEDMGWRPVEHTLSAIEPNLAFWKNSAHLGVLHHRRPVSLNIVDVALNYCNKLPFEQRITHYFKQSLWHELLLQYVPHETVEQTVMTALQPKLAKETVSA
ncbi:MAG TPA: hypothetical protein VD706_01080 [Candidatus Saccharimonadales bacterium]|nr:hypothetical protein [Candidatus Saccharimonadales bacterium]